MPESVIETFELTKEFRHEFFTWLVRARAVVEMTLRVGRGEVYGLLGPNGSGKTTTIKLLLGLLFPSSGQVAVFGKRPEDQSIKGRIGYLPEESYLYRYLDAEETLDFYGRLFALPRQERHRRTEALLDLTGLRRERHRPVAEFSKGMQRRIGLAQSLINDPELVILDEPTTGLDPIGTREIKELIRELRDKGKTVFLSSHLLADVEDVCDRVAILYGGRVQAEGPMETLLQEDRLTQITAELDAETVAAVEELIRKRQGSDTEIQIRPPQERLEQFFLRVVEEARTQRVDTSGVDASRGQLEFLSGTRGEDVLERLTAPKTEAPAAPQPERDAQPVAPVRPAGGEVLEKLASGEREAEKDQAKQETERPDERRDEGRSDLLDRLVEGDE